jgi:large subunit ribosomal protein L1
MLSIDSGAIQMTKRGKKYKNVREQISRGVSLSVDDALAKIKELAYAKFDESVDVDVNLGIDPSKGEQVVRGSVVLPHGRGKSVKVLVFAKGDYAEQAQNAGADYVGAEDLVEKITGGWMDFNYAVATPDMMGLIGKVAKLLGPRGLLPNKKLGTVTTEIAKVVGDLKKGQAFFRNDKAGIVHFSLGKASFDVSKLKDNLLAFVRALQSVKPPSSKGKYIKKMSLSSSMGVGIPVSPEEFLRA